MESLLKEKVSVIRKGTTHQRHHQERNEVKDHQDRRRYGNR